MQEEVDGEDVARSLQAGLIKEGLAPGIVQEALLELRAIRLKEGSVPEAHLDAYQIGFMDAALNVRAMSGVERDGA